MPNDKDEEMRDCQRNTERLEDEIGEQFDAEWPELDDEEDDDV